MSNPIGIYLHIPFCISKCPYCDFYSLPYCEQNAQQYVGALLHALDTAPGKGREVDSIYFGGGTPVLLGGALLEILQGVYRNFSVQPDCEVTLEANPAAMTLQTLRQLHGGGFNRISMGVQSASDRELQTLGRRHSFEQAVQSVQMAQQAGFENVSVDLMLGTPGQGRQSVEHFVSTFAQLGVQHISGYLLKIDPGTAFAKNQIERLCPDEDQSAQLYLDTVELMEQHGFLQYEISNFALPGRESRHNLKYWTLGEYAGFGPGAYSDFGGVRYGYIRDLDRYIAGELVLAESEHIPVSEREMEYIMLRLRTTEGMNIREFENRFRRRFDPLGARLEVYADHGLAQRTEQGWRLTPRGFLVSNQIIGELQELLNREKLERLRRAQEGDYRVV